MSNSRLQVKRLVSEEFREIRDSLASITFSLAGEFFYSLVFVSARAYLVAYPVIATLVPVMASVRGGVYASIGSRISTRLHLGIKLQGLRDPWLKGVFVATCLLLATVSLLVFVLNLAFTRSLSSALEALYASLSSLGLANLFLFPMITFLAITSFRRGWDPDNILAPLITLLGDVSTVPTLIIVVVVLHELGRLEALALLLAVLAVHSVFTLAGGGLQKEGFKWKRTFEELGGSMVVAVILEVVAGVQLESKIESLAVQAGVLGALPVMMQCSGALSGITASRLATGLHIGRYKPRLRPEKALLEELLRVALLGLAGYTISATIGVLAALAAGASPDLLLTYAITLKAALLLIPAIPLLSHLVCVSAFKEELDPDNVSIPILTAIMDLMTITTVLALL